MKNLIASTRARLGAAVLVTLWVALTSGCGPSQRESNPPPAPSGVGAPSSTHQAPSQPAARPRLNR